MSRRSAPEAPMPEPTTSAPNTPASGEPTQRRPYEPPRILARGTLEVMAAACTPTPPGKGAGFCSIASS